MSKASVQRLSADQPREVDPGSHDKTASPNRRHLAFYMHHLHGGGVSKMRLILAGALADRGHRVDLLVCEPEGHLSGGMPEGVRVVYLEPSSWMRARAYALGADPAGLRAVAGFALGPRSISPTLPYLPDLDLYLRREKPDVLFVATTFLAVEAALALRRSKVPTRFVISEHIHFTPEHAVVSGWNRWFIGALLHRTYSRADVLLAISMGVADEMARRSGLPRERIRTITNPTVTPRLQEGAREPLNHPWFQPGQPPVVLGVARLSRSKDFATLVRAFARVRQIRPARLLILGDAKKPKKTEKRKAELMSLAAELGVADDVSLPGFKTNPYQYMAHAGVYVLSSHFEGLPNSLIEAMACGCPVVSTDTPSGPSEILEGGKYGPLVPIGDDEAMAKAIASVLDSRPDADWLRARAADFSVGRAADRYENLALTLV